jgi:ABC-type amino acid transport substrate-binding protein
MYRTVFIIFCLFVFALQKEPVYGGEKAPEAVSSITRIKKTGVIRIAMCAFDMKPFFWNENGKLIGYDIDIINGIADTLGVKAKIDRTPKNFDSVVDYVAAGKADLAVSYLSINLKRAQKIYFTDPYVVQHPAFLIHRMVLARYKISNHNPLKRLQNHPVSVGTLTASSFYEISRANLPLAKIKTYPNWNKTVKALGKKEYEVLAVDEIAIKMLLLDDPKLALYNKPYILTSLEDPIGIGVGHGAEDLLYWLNLYIKSRKIKTDATNIVRWYKNKMKQK